MDDSHTADVAVVGAGIVGLAVALAAARRGRRVVVFEREEFAVGASVRNFGLVLPLGQPSGQLQDRALRSREVWLEFVRDADLFHRTDGMLVLARHEDEQRVLEEYLAGLGDARHGRRMLTPAEAAERSPAVRLEGLRGALFSPTEMVVDPREALRALPDWLAERFGVQTHFSAPVRAVGSGRVESSAGTWQVGRVFVCGGAERDLLYPALLTSDGAQRVKLQMLRTVPQPAGWSLGPALSAGLTLTHYPAFAACDGLAALRERFQRELPFHVQHGIHLLATPTRHGEITLGDSHEYTNTVNPFDREDLRRAMLDYFGTFARLPRPELSEQWHGVYLKHPTRTELLHEPEPGVTIVNGLGGGGMTLSFGLAEELAARQGW